MFIFGTSEVWAWNTEEHVWELCVLQCSTHFVLKFESDVYYFLYKNGDVWNE
jgi:hypothetical protein